MPPYTYVTGQHPHPVSDPAGHSYGVEIVVREIDAADWSTCGTYLFGADLFNHGYYWEAHERWEAVWHAAGRQGIVADFLKALIKLAAAGVKAREKRVEGIARHASRAQQLFTAVAADQQWMLGLEVAQLRAFSQHLQGDARRIVSSIEDGVVVSPLWDFVLFPRQPVVYMPPRSRYRGQEVDVSSRRSLQIVANQADESLLETSDHFVNVDYFYHHGTFWKARIPVDGVQHVFGQAFNFSKPKTKPGKTGPEIIVDSQGLPRRTISTLNHVQSRFVLRPDHYVELYPRVDDETGEPAERLNDFIYSLEAVGPAGIKFNLRDGLAGNLLSAHRFLSTEEMVFERVVLQNQYVGQSAPLPLDDAARRALLVKSLLRSHRAEMSERYFLYRFFGTNNCTSSPFQILDEVADYNLIQRLGSLLYRLPLNPRLYLRIRGLDADPSHSTLIRDEFADYIRSPAAQQRKRDQLRRRSKSTE